MKTRKPKASRSRAPKGRETRRSRPYPFEFRLKVVQLHLQEGYPVSLLSEQFGISCHSVRRWSAAYRKRGESGLQPKIRSGAPRRVPAKVRKKAVAIKKRHPEYGARRISDILKRFFLMPASASTVQRELDQKGLTEKRARKPVKNSPKPRFFERSRPNQLWQSDIMTFRLGGRNAYLIGYIDDYSRYITGLGLHRSQTAAHVLETYRRAIAEYGVPKEMLTDNGRQYTNWRGKTRFEREMKKDRVHHIRSRPHHPMTLGKIERFWKTILGEFLQRAQFDSFEQAVQRCAFWVKYYNYKRPHQGIGGLCPADRFFEIQHELKKTLAKGVEENALELALRGRPVDPFYMVGRMGGQSVVIRAEKGKVRMLVDGQDSQPEKELVYDARKDIHDEDSQANQKTLRAAAENHRRIVGVDRTAHDHTDVPGAVHQPGAIEPVAEPGHGGDAHSPESQESRSAGDAAISAGETDRAEPAGPHGQAAKTPEGDREIQNRLKESHEPIQCPQKSRSDHEGALRSSDSHPGGQGAGGEPQDLLQVGEARSLGPSRWAGREGQRPAVPAAGQLPEGIGATDRAAAPGQRSSEPKDGAKGHLKRFEAEDRQEPVGKKMSESWRRFR